MDHGSLKLLRGSVGWFMGGLDVSVSVARFGIRRLSLAVTLCLLLVCSFVLRVP